MHLFWARALGHIKVKKTHFWLQSHFWDNVENEKRWNKRRCGRRMGPQQGSILTDGWLPGRWHMWWGREKHLVFKGQTFLLGQRVNALHCRVLSEGCSAWDSGSFLR